MKTKTYRFISSWSNHPDGRDSKHWEPEEPPQQVEINGKNIQLYSEVDREYLPQDWERQTPKNGYWKYADCDIKVKIDESGDTNHPCGTYIKTVTFLNLSKYL